VRYRLALTATGARHTTVVRHRHVVQAPTGKPPVIKALRSGRSTVEYVGGQVTVATTVKHVKRCHLSVAPAGVTVTGVGVCSAGDRAWRLQLPPNPAESSIAYTATLTAVGSHGRRTTNAVTVTARAHPPPCPGQTSTATPTTMSMFNDPSTGQPADQSRVVAAEINLICAAQLPVRGEHTQIWMAQFVFTLDDVAQALVWAHRYQHADVHLVLDGSNEFMFNPDGSHVPNVAYDDVVANLPSSSLVVCGPNAGTVGRPVVPDDEDESAVFPAGTGCAGDNILHVKLLAISAVDPAGDPAVFSSSQNFSTGAMTAGFNDGLQVVGDAALYGLDAAYIDRLAGNRQQADLGLQLGPAAHDSGGARLWSTFYPRNLTDKFPDGDPNATAHDAATDSLAATLRNVRCTAPGRYAGDHSHGARTTIRIAMFVYRTREAVTAALDRLGDDGCDIGIIYSVISAPVLQDLESHGIRATQLYTEDYTPPSGQPTRLFVHDKFVLISGGIAVAGRAESNQDLVLAGSPNLTDKALYDNDEAGLAYQQTATAAAGSTPIFDGYAHDWDRLLAVAASLS